MTTYGTMGHEEMLREFGFEGAGGVACIKRDLAALRRNPGDRECLDRVQTWLRTVCGASSFLGLMRLVGITHSGAEILAGLRDGSVSFRPDAGRALTELLETMEAAFRRLTRGQAWEGDPAPLLIRLQSCLPEGVGSVSASCGTFRTGPGPKTGERSSNHGKDGGWGDGTPGSGGPRRIEGGTGMTGEPEVEKTDSAEPDADAPVRGAARPGLRLVRRVVSGLRALVGLIEGSRRHRTFALEWGEAPGAHHRKA